MREGPIRLSFAPATRVAGHAVLLPYGGGRASFQALRPWMLDNLGAREHAAHLTLAHPRNARAIGNTDEAVEALPKGRLLRFASVALIRQHGAGPWRAAQEAPLGGAAAGDGPTASASA